MVLASEQGVEAVPHAQWETVILVPRINWPAAGSVDTELRCLMELEVSNGETEVQPRVQA